MLPKHVRNRSVLYSNPDVIVWFPCLPPKAVLIATFPVVPTTQDLARKSGTGAARGCASSRFTSASVAALTCWRVMLRDRNCFVFAIVHVYARSIEGAMVPKHVRTFPRSE